jgi:hypothetical protein
MAAAVALREEISPAGPAPAWTREQVLTRYRHFRAISKQHHSGAMDFLAKDAILQQARRLGLARGKMLMLDDMDELTYAFDLAIHTAPADRSRAIDHYARSARLPQGSDEALMLDAMRQARFSIICIKRRHEAAGLIVQDVFRGIEHWLVDEGLESSVSDGSVLATRLFTPDRFSMAAGVFVPFDLELMEDVLLEAPQLGRKRPAEACDDRRFAEAIYRIALADGVMQRVAYRDPISEAG